MSKTSHFAALFPALVLVPPGPAPAQAPQPGPRVEAAVSVTAVDLDVSVTKSGEPVPDARPEDILLKIDGKLVPLDYFTRVETGRLTGPAREAAGARTDVDRHVARTFLILIDEDHLMPVDRARVVEAARALVAGLGPSDRLAVGVLDGLEFRVGSPVGTGRSAALMAIEQIATGRKLGLAGWGNIDLQSGRSREARTFRELERAVRALGAFPGRKELILVSRGFVRFDGLRSFGKVLPITEEYENLVRQANCSRVTIHTVSAGGLEAAGRGAESGGIPFG